MGLSAEFFFNLVRNKEFLKDKNVALVGIPCPENTKLMHQYLKKFLPPDLHKKIYKSERNMFGKILFRDFIICKISSNFFDGTFTIFEFPVISPNISE